MQEKELEIAGGNLYYAEDGDGILITGLHGLCGEVHIPERIDNQPVREIAKKAFLSKKYLRKVCLPETVEAIGDWAFAYCDNLEQVTLPGKRLEFGKAVFLDCKRLKRLEISRDAGSKQEAIATLLAAAVTAMQAPYMLDIEEAGSEEWLNKWDARMLEIWNCPDEEGFSRQILCGEEDYGSTDLSAYVNERRKSKVRLLLLRCLYDVGLEETLREQMMDYLRAHTKGCASEETWQVILQEHGNDRTYYRLFTELSCLSLVNFNDVIADIGDAYPEMKAFFLRYKEEKIGYGDFFSELEL